MMNMSMVTMSLAVITMINGNKEFPPAALSLHAGHNAERPSQLYRPLLERDGVVVPVWGAVLTLQRKKKHLREFYTFQ